MKLYVFGNEYLSEDNMAVKVANILECDIVHLRSPDMLLGTEGDIVILDVVKGIEEVIVIDDISKLKDNPLVSMHDFDLSFFLKMMKELGDERKVVIIGVPSEGDVNVIADSVKEIVEGI